MSHFIPSRPLLSIINLANWKFVRSWYSAWVSKSDEGNICSILVLLHWKLLQPALNAKLRFNRESAILASDKIEPFWRWIFSPPSYWISTVNKSGSLNFRSNLEFFLDFNQIFKSRKSVCFQLQPTVDLTGVKIFEPTILRR